MSSYVIVRENVAAPGGEHVVRAQLLHRIVRPEAPPFQLLIAGPGYGKTAILEQVCRRAKAEQQDFLYIGFNDSAVDLDTLVAALQAAATELYGETSAEHVSNHLRSDASARLHGRPVWLAIDNLHTVNTPSLAAILARMLQLLPAGSRIIGSGRFSSNSQIVEEARTNGALLLTEDDLRFDGEEMKVFEGGSPALAKELYDEAHGWPAGVEIVQRCVTSSAVLARDLIERCILSGIATVYEAAYPGLMGDEPFGQFVEQIALYEEFSVELASAHSSLDVAIPFIGRLASMGILFSKPQSGEVFRLCTPFRHYVRKSAESKNPQRFHHQVEAIAAQFIDQRRWEEARTVMALAPAAVRQKIVETAGGWMLDVRFGLSVFQDFGLEEPESFAHLPRLGLARAIHLARAGLAQEARSLFDQVAQQHPPSANAIWNAELSINRIRIGVFSDRKLDSAMLDALKAVTDSDLGNQPVLYAITAAVLCDGYYGMGYYQSSREVGRRGLVLCDHYEAPYAASYIYAFTAMAEYRLGDLAQAVAISEKMTQHIAKNFAPASSLHDVCAIILAVIRYEEGKLAEAERLLDRPLDLVLDQEGWLEIGAAGFMTAANTAILNANYESALTYISAAEHAGARHGFPRLIQMAQCRAVYLLSVANRVGEAADISARDNFPLRPMDPATSQWRDYVSVARILAESTYLVVKGDFVSSIAQLDAFLGEPGSTQNVPSYVRVMCLKLVAAAGGGRPPEEIASIIRTIYLYVEKKGYLSPLMELPFLGETLELCSLDPQIPADARQIAGKLLARFRQCIASVETTPASLSPRQTQILNLLAEGLSNKEIASQLELAEGTVKSYRKTLYQKLDVSRRSQAVARARERQ